jgi:hypothetical protein
MKVSGFLVKLKMRLPPGGGMSEVVVLKAHKVNKVLPPGYRVDHDPDVAVLRRADDSVVAYFPIWTMSPERILRAAELDLIADRRASGGLVNIRICGHENP